MTFRNKLYVFFLLIPGLLVCIIVLAGVLVINNIIYSLQRDILKTEVFHVRRDIEKKLQSLRDDGTDHIPAYITKTQDEIIAMMREEHFGAGGQTFVVSTDGRVIYHPDIQNIEKDQLPFPLSIWQFPSGDFTFDFDGKSHFCMYNTFPQWNWIIGISIPTDRMFRQRGKYLWIALAIATLFMATGLFFSYILSRRLAQRIDDSLTCVQRVTRGNLNVQIENAETQDELGMLQRGINAMINEIGNCTTEHSRAEAALQESEERFGKISHSSPIGMLMFQLEPNGHLVLVDANPAANRLLGMNNSQFIGKTIEKAFPLLAETEFPEVCRLAAAKGEYWKSEQIDYEHGQIKGIFEIHAFQTAPGEMVAMLRDITERKRTEEEIRRLNEELEHRVMERTAELEIVNRELKDFAYIVSHDLKAPLRAISQLAGWLSEDYAKAFDDEGKEQMNLLVGRVKRMDGLIDGILQYSRIGRIERRQGRINFNELVKDSIEMLAPPDHIRVIIEDDLPVIVCDKTHFEQIFQNLLGNAIKFMDKQEGKIQVGCIDEGTRWQFSVRDNGQGIEKRHHKRIFQIFQTLASRDQRESTGIGLTIVKKIVELRGGQIWVESEIGKGSAFFFTLPKNEGGNET